MRDHVLVIDDDPDFRELIKISVMSSGLRCLEARDCPSALAVLDRERGRVRIVLLDYFLLEGPVSTACVRELASRLDAGVPIVLVSAAVDIVERAKELGLDRFLAKPFDLDDLRALVLDPSLPPA